MKESKHRSPPVSTETLWRFVVLVTAEIAISYLNRQTLPVAISAIQSTIPLNDQQFSCLLRAFIIPDAVLNVGGGRLLDEMGGPPYLDPPQPIDNTRRTSLMQYKTFLRFIVCLGIFPACAFVVLGAASAQQTLNAATSSSAKPLMKLLSLFTAPDVPEMAPTESEAPRDWKEKPVPNGLPGHGLAQHPMLFLGEGYNKLMIIDRRKIIWSYQTGGGWEYDDAWMLSNGNILFTRMQYTAEIRPDKRVVWRYDAPPGTEIHTCQPIGLDKALFIENGLPPHLKVVNIRTNAVEVDHVLPSSSLTDRQTVHAQFRRVRYTAKGTYLVPFLEMNRVVEYDKDFKEIWRYDVPTPWAAIRLKNGNTLITDEHDVTTFEVTPDKKIVWRISAADIPAQYRYENSQSATRLANGDTILCSRGGSNEGPQLVEVSRAKKVVWVLQDWIDLGPATAVQILDDPGIPETPGDSEH